MELSGGKGTDMANSKPVAHEDLLTQMVAEVDAMAEYIVASGLAVPAADVQTVLQLQGRSAPPTSADLARLTQVHEALRRVIAPATPRTVRLLSEESHRQRLVPWLPSLGPIRVVRQMMVAGLFFLVALIALGLSNDVGRDSGGIFDSSGTTLLLNLLFVLSAAGLGALFASLFKINGFISDGTYDPTFEASYWINVVLGLIAGLLLAELIPEALDTGGGGGFNFARPVLALVGGFSATAVFRILRKLVDAVESVFRGSTQELLASQVEAARSRLSLQQAEDRIRLSTKLVDLQKALGAGADSTVLGQGLDALLNDLLPFGAGRPAPAPPASDGSEESGKPSPSPSPKGAADAGPPPPAPGGDTPPPAMPADAPAEPPASG